MHDEAVPLFVVKADPDDEAAPARYWTGKMNGSWPEYLKNRDRALRCKKPDALLAASQFNQRTANCVWSAEPV